MDKKITFKAEVTFTGTQGQFVKLATALKELPIKVRGLGWPPGHEVAGCWPLRLEKILGRIRLISLIREYPRIKNIPIPGGIRLAHVHIGHDIVFIDQKKFKQIVGEVVTKLARKMTGKAEYVKTVGAIRNLVPGAK